MSFVVFVGCQYFGIMLGDKRCISYDNKIRSDNANKIYRINSNIVMCTGGDTSIKQYVIDGLNTQNNIESLNYDEVKHIVYNRLEKVRDYINLKGYKEMNSSIGIMGIKNKKVYFVSLYVTYNEIKIVEKIYTNGDNGYCVVANGKTQLEKIFQKKLLDIIPCSINEIIQIFSEILQEQSKSDISINSLFDYEYIVNNGD